MVRYLSFFIALQQVLPCRACRESTLCFYTSGDTKLTMDVMRSRETLARWVWKLHNRVNRRLSKPCNVSFSEMCQRYERFRAACAPKKHGCEAPRGHVRKRAVVLILTDEQADKMGLHSSVVDISSS